MPRSSQYVILLKKLIAATQQEDRAEFERQVEEIRAQMSELEDGERFDLEINIKSETKTYLDRFIV